MLGALGDVGRTEAELFQGFGAHGRGAEALQTDYISVSPDILPPGHGSGSFDRERW